MEGDERRQFILKLLAGSESPLSGTEIAGKCGVSRQIIVQDIALLRATNKNILSTYRGYLLYQPEKDTENFKRTFAVSHTDEQIQDELYTFVDCGGKVLDVTVMHEIYGAITVDLILNNRVDVDDFTTRLFTTPAKPLKELTGGNHMHTVEASSPEVFDRIEEQLKKKGYLLR